MVRPHREYLSLAHNPYLEGFIKHSELRKRRATCMALGSQEMTYGLSTLSLQPLKCSQQYADLLTNFKISTGTPVHYVNLFLQQPPRPRDCTGIPISSHIHGLSIDARVTTMWNRLLMLLQRIACKRKLEDNWITIFPLAAWFSVSLTGSMSSRWASLISLHSGKSAEIISANFTC